MGLAAIFSKLKQAVWVLALAAGLGLAGLPLTAGAQGTMPTPPVVTTNANLIHVGLSQTPEDDTLAAYAYPSAQIGATGAFEVTDAQSQRVYFSPTANQLGVWVNNVGGWLKTPDAKVLGPVALPLTLQPLALETARVKVGSLRRKTGQGTLAAPTYRGQLQVVRFPNTQNRFSLVNVLDSQDYLRAVVPNELPMRFGLEAVKAQSIAARTYALNPREKPWPHFDICDTPYCQAYYGEGTETPGSDEALEATHGLILLYAGQPILALYSSSHGGYAEAYHNVFSNPKTGAFPDAPLPYLPAHPDVPEALASLEPLSTEANAQRFWSSPNWPSFDEKSSLYRWQRSWSGSELRTVLQRSLPKLWADPLTQAFISPAFEEGTVLGPLASVQITQRGQSGKAMALTVTTQTGQQWVLRKEFLIRRALQTLEGGRWLPSANGVLLVEKDAKIGVLKQITFKGGGFGHGVGMSQYGASYLSGTGWDFSRILAHYYPGAVLATVPMALPHAGQAVQVQFVPPPQASARLCIKGPIPAGATVTLNQQALPLPSSQKTGAEPINCTPVEGAGLLPNALNTLQLQAPNPSPLAPKANTPQSGLPLLGLAQVSLSAQSLEDSTNWWQQLWASLPWFDSPVPSPLFALPFAPAETLMAQTQESEQGPKSVAKPVSSSQAKAPDESLPQALPTVWLAF